MAKFANAPQAIGMLAERQRVFIRAAASREGFAVVEQVFGGGVLE